MGGAQNLDWVDLVGLAMAQQMATWMADDIDIFVVYRLDQPARHFRLTSAQAVMKLGKHPIQLHPKSASDFPLFQ